MPQGGGGFIQPGDHVNVFATLSNVNLIRLDSLNALLRASANTQTRKVNIGDFTVSVVPDVRVLKASAPPESAEGRSSNRVGIQVLLELKPEDAQKVIFANEKGSVWLALMYPGDEGVSPTPVNAVDILTRA
jgi:Flp pilus assembly protein CpaB